MLDGGRTPKVWRKSRPEFSANDLVDYPAVGAAARQAAHHTFHHTAEILRRCGAGFTDGFVDCTVDLGGIDRRRHVGLEDGDLRGFSRREIVAPAFEELLD